jgi:hypothetical protein
MFPGGESADGFGGCGGVEVGAHGSGLDAVGEGLGGSVIALSHEYHDRANLSVGGKAQLSYRS